MTQPLRLQRSRARGAKLPADTIYVGRPSKWGNPFVTHSDRMTNGRRYPMTPEVAVSSFRSLLAKQDAWFPVPLPWPRGKIPACEPTTIADVRRELAGHHLACWCRLCPEHRAGKPLGMRCGACAPCHVDVLGELLCEGMMP